VGFVEEKVALEQVSSEYLRFHCQFSFLLTAPCSPIAIIITIIYHPGLVQQAN
jgi:hypothetical protein